MDLRRMKIKIKPKFDLTKKIKTNPKYENVQTKVNTGNNTRKLAEKMQEAGHYYRFRPDEIFRRITATSMVSLMLEQSKLEIQENDEHLASQNGGSSSREENSFQSPSAPSTERDEENEKINNAEEEVDSGVDGENGVDSPYKEEENENSVPDKQFEEPEQEADFELIESIVFKGKFIKRQLSVQSHSKSVADLFSGVSSVDDNNMSITGSRKGSNSSHASSGFHHHDSSMAKSTFMIPGAEDEILKPDRMMMLQQEQQSLHRSVSEGHLLKNQISIKEEIADEMGENIWSADRPFLLLDIRPTEKYESGHIKTARSYPHVRLARAVNFETPEMLAYKNRESKLIVVYDYDEAIAAKFATTMMQRGYDNVFLLSGGLRVAYIKFPERLVTKSNIENMEGDEKLGDEDILVIESFLEEALTTDVRLNHYAPSTVGDGRSMAPTPSVSSSRMQKHAPKTTRDGSMSRVSRLTDAQKRSASPMKKHRQLPLPFNERPSEALASNMHKR